MAELIRQFEKGNRMLDIKKKISFINLLLQHAPKTNVYVNKINLLFDIGLFLGTATLFIYLFFYFYYAS